MKSVNDVCDAIQHGTLNAEELSVSPNATDADGCSLLHWAAINNRVRIAKELIRQGAMVNLRGGTLGETPLMWASRFFYPRMVTLLLENGAEVGLKSKLGYDALHLACQSGNINIVLILLALGQAPPNQVIDFDGNTAFLFLVKNRDRSSAMSTCSLDLCRVLCNDIFDIDIGAVDLSGNNALHILAGSPFKFNSREREQGLAAGDADNPNPKVALYTSAPANRDRDMKLALLLLTKCPQIATAKNAAGKTPLEVSMLPAINNTLIQRLLNDFGMYNRFPRALPSLITCSVVISLFVWLQIFGWLLGCLSFSISLLVFDRFSQASLRQHEGRLWFGLNLGLITTLSGVYLWFLRSHYSNLLNLLFCLEVFGIYLTLHRTTTTEPASLAKTKSGDKRSLHRILDRIVEEGPQEGLPLESAVAGQFVVCATCLNDKLAASVHCSCCDRCMIAVDHHCPYVNNCVGKGNRRSFLLFCLFAAIGSAWMGVSSIWVEYNVLCVDIPLSNFFLLRALNIQSCVAGQNPALAASTWLALVVSIWTAVMFTQQLVFVANETSSLEVMQGRVSGKCRVGCIRAFGNIWRFFQSGTYSLAAPQAAPGHRHPQDESHAPLIANISSPSAKKRANSAQLSSRVHGGHMEV